MKRQAWLVPILLAFGVPLSVHAQSARPSSPFTGQTDDDETVYLSPFEVSSAVVGGYHVVDSTVSRSRRALIDTPNSIQVVTSEFMNDIGAGSILDAVKYLSGMGTSYLAGVGGIQERQIVRGFEQFGGMLDRIPRGGIGPVESEILEQVEVVKGPVAMINGSANVGGEVTSVSKSPKFESIVNILKVEVADEYFGNKATFDSTGKVPGTDRFAYRLIATQRDAHSYVPGRLELKTINPMLTWKIADTSQLKLKAFLNNWRQTGVQAANSTNIHIRDDFPYGTGATISKADIKPGYVPFGVNGSAPWTVRAEKIRRYQAEFTTALTKQLDLRLAVAHERIGDRQLLGEVRIDRSVPPGTYPGRELDPNTGRETPNYYWGLQDNTQPWHEQTNPYVSTYVDPTSNISKVELRSGEGGVGNSGIWYTDLMYYQADLAGKFDFGGTPSDPLFTLRPTVGLGWDIRKKVTTKGYAPLVEDITGIYDPSWPYMPNPRPPTMPPGPRVQSWEQQELRDDRVRHYANIQLDTFRQRLVFTGGVSYYKVATENQNIIPNGNYTNRSRSGTSPSFGAVFKITPDVAVYASYSENTNRGNYYAGDGLPPVWISQPGKQNEVGVKLYLFNKRLSVTTSYFEIEKENIARDDPQDVVAGRTGTSRLFASLVEDITNEGVEFDIVGKITSNLSVLGSATKQKFRNNAGYKQRNTADAMYNAFLRYGFSSGILDGLSVQLGFNHVGGRPGDNPSTSPTVRGVRREHAFFLPSYTLFSAGAGYTWNRVSFQLNIDNLLDEDKPYVANGRQSVELATPRNIRLTTTIRF